MKINAQIEIEGVKPILFHTFPIELLAPGKSRGGTAGNSTEEWKKTVLYDQERNIYVLGSYLSACIKAGGKNIKVGKGNLSKKVAATLEVLQDRLYIIGAKLPEEADLSNDPTQPVYLDVRSVVNPMTKGRNLRYRVAAKPGWSLRATISWDDFAVSKEEMKNSLEHGGLFDGIGDGRSIGFGRFKVVEFKVIN